MNAILFLYMIITYFGYLYWTTKKYGLQKDISNTLYVLPDNYKFIFGAFCISYALPAMIIAQHWLIYLAGLGILNVSVAPVRSGFPSSKFHMYSSRMSFISSTLYILCIVPNGVYISLAIMTALLSVTYVNKLQKSIGFWQEVIATIGMFVALLYNL